MQTETEIQIKGHLLPRDWKRKRDRKKKEEERNREMGMKKEREKMRRRRKRRGRGLQKENCTKVCENENRFISKDGRFKIKIRRCLAGNGEERERRRFRETIFTDKRFFLLRLFLFFLLFSTLVTFFFSFPFRSFLLLFSAVNPNYLIKTRVVH